MTAVGTPKEHAIALADVLLEADRRGHYSHGLNRLGKEKIIKKTHREGTIIKGCIFNCIVPPLCSFQKHLTPEAVLGSIL